MGGLAMRALLRLPGYPELGGDVDVHVVDDEDGLLIRATRRPAGNFVPLELVFNADAADDLLADIREALG
jgi:hypothetical protein